MYTPGPCSNNPTRVSQYFDPTNYNTTGVIHDYAPFTGARFGGYVVSGEKYETKLCLI